MKKLLLSMVATLALLAMPGAAYAAGGKDNDGNTMRGNQFVNRNFDVNDANMTGNNVNRTNMTGTMNGRGNNGFRSFNANNGRFNNDNWNNNMTTRNYRAAATNDNDTDWGWLGLLGLVGLAGMMGRGRDRGDAR